MFDLDKIEAEWESLNLRLSDEEIFEIFNSEGATMREYLKMLSEFEDTIPKWYEYKTAEERLLNSIFNIQKETPDVTADMSDEEFEYNWDMYCFEQFKWAEEEYDDFFEYPESETYTQDQKFEIVMDWVRDKLKEERKEYEAERKVRLNEKERLIKFKEYRELQKTGKKHLSPEGQKKVVAGTLNIVFDQTRYYYEFFDKKISQETLYYICLYALMNAVKYLCISSKIFYGEGKISLFRLYVEKSIRDAMIKYLAKNEHTGYREIYRKLTFCMMGDAKDYFHLDYEEEKEISTSPFELRDTQEVSHDYISDTNSSEFMRIYHKALSKFDPIERRVMELAYDSYGYPNLTHQEIGTILRISSSQVASIKKRVIGYLQNDEELIRYKLDLDGHLNTSILTDDEKRIMDLTVSGLDIKLISEYTGLKISKIAKIRTDAFRKMSVFEKKKRAELRRKNKEDEKRIRLEEKEKRKLKEKKRDDYFYNTDDSCDDIPFL